MKNSIVRIIFAIVPSPKYATNMNAITITNVAPVVRIMLGLSI